jgi:hypothetical protein
MEGIDQLEPNVARLARRQWFEPPAREWRMVERWLLVCFGIAVVGTAVFALGLAAAMTH